MSFEENEISLLPLAGCRKPKIGDSNIDGDDDTVQGRSSGSRHDSCVLLMDDCFYEFVNPIDMDVIVDHPTCNSVPSTPIGHCGSHVLGHPRQCAIAPGSCADPDSWVRPSQSMSQYVNVNFGCTILQDLNYHNENHDYQEGGALTRYTGCKGGAMETDALDVVGSVTSDGAICVATVAECLELVGQNDDDNAASFEIDLVHEECDCSKTRIGACFRMKDALDSSVNVLDRYFCAIEPEVCDEELGLTYQSVDQLMRYSDIDCRLCDARSVIDYKVAVSKLKPQKTGNAAVFGIAFGSAIGSVIFLVLLHSGFLLLKGKNSSAVAELSAAELVDADVDADADADVDADASVVDLDADTEDVKVHEAEFS